MGCRSEPDWTVDSRRTYSTAVGHARRRPQARCRDVYFTRNIVEPDTSHEKRGADGRKRRQSGGRRDDGTLKVTVFVRSAQQMPDDDVPSDRLPRRPLTAAARATAGDIFCGNELPAPPASIAAAAGEWRCCAQGVDSGRDDRPLVPKAPASIGMALCAAEPRQSWKRLL